MRILALLILLATSVFGQTVSGTLECRVTDSSGAYIVAADIKVVNQETGLERATRTNHEGYAQLTFLPPGQYTISAAAPGFTAQTRAAQVDLNSSRSFPFTLMPTGVTTEVTVTAEAPLLDTTRGEITQQRRFEDD